MYRSGWDLEVGISYQKLNRIAERIPMAIGTTQRTLNRITYAGNKKIFSLINALWTIIRGSYLWAKAG